MQSKSLPLILICCLPAKIFILDTFAWIFVSHSTMTTPPRIPLTNIPMTHDFYSTARGLLRPLIVPITIHAKETKGALISYRIVNIEYTPNLKREPTTITAGSPIDWFGGEKVGISSSVCLHLKEQNKACCNEELHRSRIDCA